MIEKSLVGTFLGRGRLLAGVSLGDLRQAYALWSILEGENAEDGSANGYDSRYNEAPALSPYVRGITHYLIGLVGSAHTVPALDAGG